MPHTSGTSTPGLSPSVTGPHPPTGHKRPALSEAAEQRGSHSEPSSCCDSQDSCVCVGVVCAFVSCSPHSTPSPPSFWALWVRERDWVGWSPLGLGPSAGESAFHLGFVRHPPTSPEAGWHRTINLQDAAAVTGLFIAPVFFPNTETSHKGKGNEISPLLRVPRSRLQGFPEALVAEEAGERPTALPAPPPPSPPCCQSQAHIPLSRGPSRRFLSHAFLTEAGDPGPSLSLTALPARTLRVSCAHSTHLVLFLPSLLSPCDSFPSLCVCFLLCQ